MNLTSEDLQKLQTKQVANIIRKLNAGKSITAREEAILAQARAAGDPEAAPAPTAPASGFVKTWDELATACHIDRRTLTNVRQKHGKKCPKAKADGRHEIAAWITFLDSIGVKGRGENNPDIDFLDERTLRLEERKLKVERERHLLAREKDQLVPIAHIAAALGQALATFNQALDALPGRIADGIDEADRDELIKLLTRAEKEKITFKRLRNMIARGEFRFADFHARRAFVSGEVKALQRTLAQCAYFEIDPDAET